MTTKTPHDDWVLLEAAKRSGLDAYTTQVLRETYCDGGSFRALCHMIAAYEEPPVDRKLLCAREALAEASIAHADVMWTDEDIATRAIELWEEGFGK
jgi:hypothetical protein